MTTLRQLIQQSLKFRRPLKLTEEEETPSTETSTESEPAEEPEEEETSWECPNCNTIHDSMGSREENEEDQSIVGNDGTQGCHDCMAMCPDCEEFSDSDNFNEVYAPQRGRSWRNEQRQVCNDCLSDHYFQCADCREHYHNDAASGVNSNDDTICSNCAENYFYCEGCNNTFHTDDYGEDGMCQNCMEDEDAGGQIHDYSYTPRPWIPRGGVGRKYGVELETVLKHGDLRDAAEHTLNILNEGLPEEGFAFLKKDGSLSGGVGAFEIVTHPATLAYHEARWKPFFADKPRGMVSHDAPCDCGLHIHVERAGLSQLEIAKMVMFTNAAGNKKFVEAIARRSSPNWAKLDPKKPISEIRNREGGKYEAVNLLHPKSLEFRIFKGTLNSKSFFRSLEFVDALTDFVKSGTMPLTATQKYDHFFDFVRSRWKDYPILADFIDNYTQERNLAKGDIYVPNMQLMRLGNDPDKPIDVPLRPKTRMWIDLEVYRPLTPEHLVSVLHSRLKAAKIAKYTGKELPRRKSLHIPPEPTPTLPPTPTPSDGKDKQDFNAVNSLFGHDPQAVEAWQRLNHVLPPHTDHAAKIVAGWMGKKKPTDEFDVSRIVDEHLGPETHPLTRFHAIQALQGIEHPNSIHTQLDTQLDKIRTQPDFSSFLPRSGILNQLIAPPTRPATNQIVRSINEHSPTQAREIFTSLENVGKSLENDPNLSLEYRRAIRQAANKLGWTEDQVSESVWTILTAFQAMKSADPKTINSALDSNAALKGWLNHERHGIAFLANPGMSGPNRKGYGQLTGEDTHSGTASTSRSGILRGSHVPPIEDARPVTPINPLKSNFKNVLTSKLKSYGLQLARDGNSIKLIAQYDRPVDFNNAQSRIESVSNAPLIEGLRQALQRSGVIPHTVTSAIHDFAGMTRASLLAVGKAANPYAPQVGTAWMGLLGHQPGLISFRGNPRGKDSIYVFNHHNADIVRNVLQNAGVVSRTIVPNERHYTVYVYDPGNRDREKVATALATMKATAIEWRGDGNMVGGDESDMGRSQYRNVINQSESGATHFARPLTDEETLFRSVTAKTHDDAPWLILADRMDELGKPNFASFLRLLTKNPAIKTLYESGRYTNPRTPYRREISSISGPIYPIPSWRDVLSAAGKIGPIPITATLKHGQYGYYPGGPEPMEHGPYGVVRVLSNPGRILGEGTTTLPELQGIVEEAEPRPVSRLFAKPRGGFRKGIPRLQTYSDTQLFWDRLKERMKHSSETQQQHSQTLESEPQNEPGM